MPAFDKQWINVLHMTTNGNKDADKIFRLCIYRNGLLGQFAFKFWGQRKEMHFALGTTYHVTVEQFKRSRGSSYGFLITVDGVDLVQKSLKAINVQTYTHVKVFTSNPWQPTMPSKVGAVRNFKINTGRSQNCCKIVFLWIDQSYLSMLHAGAQKSLIGEYTYKGNVNGKNYWIKNDGKQAMWYFPKYNEWCVGSIQYLGTNWRGISAGQTSAKCPTQNRKRWSYFNGIGWKTELKPHIQIHCKDNFIDYHKEILLPTGNYLRTLIVANEFFDTFSS